MTNEIENVFIISGCIVAFMILSTCWICNIYNNRQKTYNEI